MPTCTQDLNLLRRMKPTDLSVALKLVDMGRVYAGVLAEQQGHILSHLSPPPGPLPGLLLPKTS